MYAQLLDSKALTALLLKESQKKSLSVPAVPLEEENLIFCRVVIEVTGKMSDRSSSICEILECLSRLGEAPTCLATNRHIKL